MTTLMLGTDWSWGQGQGTEARRSTAGLLLSRSTALGGYGGGDQSGDVGDGGNVKTTLTGVFPWTRHRFTDRLEVWGGAGYSQGELEVTPKLADAGKDGATLTTDLSLWQAAGGLRGTLLAGGKDGFTLTGKTDVMAVGTASGQVTGKDGNLAAAQATVTRLRLGLEAQRPFSLGDSESGAGARLTPSLELGLRLDGGDAETGFGLDLGSGIVLSHPVRGGCKRSCGDGGYSPTQRRASGIKASPIPSPGNNGRIPIWAPCSPSAKPWVGCPRVGRTHCSPASTWRGWPPTTPATMTT